MGGMEPNPYEAPAAAPHALPPRRLPVGARITRVGAMLTAIGVFVFLGCFAAFGLFDGKEPPDWYARITLSAVAMVPIGVAIAVVGGAVWLCGNLWAHARPPNP